MLYRLWSNLIPLYIIIYYLYLWTLCTLALVIIIYWTLPTNQIRIMHLPIDILDTYCAVWFNSQKHFKNIRTKIQFIFAARGIWLKTFESLQFTACRWTVWNNISGQTFLGPRNFLFSFQSSFIKAECWQAVAGSGCERRQNRDEKTCDP